MAAEPTSQQIDRQLLSASRGTRFDTSFVSPVPGRSSAEAHAHAAAQRRVELRRPTR